MDARPRLRGGSIPREYRTNELIKLPEVRVVDETGKQLGVMPTRQALELAEDRDLDLVEVAPSEVPPVCRLMDYGKFKYQATRRERDARKTQRAKSTTDLREVRFKTRIGEHDKQAKIRLVRRLLGEGSKVKVSVMFRGREITHPEVGMAVLKSVADELVDDALMEKTPSFEGRFLTMIVTPNASAKNASTRTKEPQSAET